MSWYHWDIISKQDFVQEPKKERKTMAQIQLWIDVVKESIMLRCADNSKRWNYLKLSVSAKALSRLAMGPLIDMVPLDAVTTFTCGSHSSTATRRVTLSPTLGMLSKEDVNASPSFLHTLNILAFVCVIRVHEELLNLLLFSLISSSTKHNYILL